MAKKTIITIAGTLGSGKSSTAKKVAMLLNYKRASTGDFMRSIAEERKLTLNELSKHAEIDESIDIALDNYNKEVGEQKEIVLDSRLGWYFIPDAFKVFLNLKPAIAAVRILKDLESNPNRSNEDHNGFDSIESITTSIEKRLKSERKRYRDLYKISDHTDPKNFDLVIDTSLYTLDQVVEQIIVAYDEWLQS